MYQFFESTIRPLLDVTEFRTMIEVGADKGRHTSRLLPYARSRGAHLHVIDPDSSFNAGSYGERFAAHSTLHVQPSLDALPAIADPDVVLLDGDHNWYTVMEELRTLERTAADWPLTFMHNVEWPYARRDMYYAPMRVPEEFRHPYAYSGIVYGRSELSETGVNTWLANAVHEGGPRNGVLTAIEDFFEETPRDLVLYTAPGEGGLGILIDRSRLRDRSFAKVLRKCAKPKLAQRRALGA